jgi:membrane-associated PAP2 superfamily phosphatase
LCNVKTNQAKMLSLEFVDMAKACIIILVVYLARAMLTGLPFDQILAQYLFKGAEVPAADQDVAVTCYYHLIETILCTALIAGVYKTEGNELSKNTQSVKVAAAYVVYILIGSILSSVRMRYGVSGSDVYNAEPSLFLLTLIGSPIYFQLMDAQNPLERHEFAKSLLNEIESLQNKLGAKQGVHPLQECQ